MALLLAKKKFSTPDNAPPPKPKTPTPIKLSVPCRVMNKSVDNEEHGFVPQSEHFKKFDGVSGCRITTKNKHMPDYHYIYPMLDTDGKVRSVTENDFHCRVSYKHRGYLGYKYIYPVLDQEPTEEVVPDELLIVDGWDERADKTFVPDDVDRMCPLGVYRIRKSPNTDDLFIVSNRGDIYMAQLRTIEKRKDLKYDGEIPKPVIRTLLEVNGLGDVDYSQDQLEAIEAWRENMQRLSFTSMGGSKFSSAGAYLEPGEWKDESIFDFFAANYPDEEDAEAGASAEVETEETQNEPEDNADSQDRTSALSTLGNSMEEEDSGYVERRKASFVSSRMSCDSFYSDEVKNSEETVKNSENVIENVAEKLQLDQDQSVPQPENADSNDDDEFHDCDSPLPECETNPEISDSNQFEGDSNCAQLTETGRAEVDTNSGEQIVEFSQLASDNFAESNQVIDQNCPIEPSDGNCSAIFESNLAVANDICPITPEVAEINNSNCPITTNCLVASEIDNEPTEIFEVINDIKLEADCTNSPIEQAEDDNELDIPIVEDNHSEIRVDDVNFEVIDTKFSVTEKSETEYNESIDHTDLVSQQDTLETDSKQDTLETDSTAFNLGYEPETDNDVAVNLELNPWTCEYMEPDSLEFNREDVMMNTFDSLVKPHLKDSLVGDIADSELTNGIEEFGTNHPNGTDLFGDVQENNNCCDKNNVKNAVQDKIEDGSDDILEIQLNELKNFENTSVFTNEDGLNLKL